MRPRRPRGAARAGGGCPGPAARWGPARRSQSRFPVQARGDRLPHKPRPLGRPAPGFSDPPPSHPRLAWVFLSLTCINFYFITCHLSRRVTETRSRNHREMRLSCAKSDNSPSRLRICREAPPLPQQRAHRVNPRASAWTGRGLSVDSHWLGNKASWAPLRLPAADRTFFPQAPHRERSRRQLTLARFAERGTAAFPHHGTRSVCFRLGTRRPWEQSSGGPHTRFTWSPGASGDGHTQTLGRRRLPPSRRRREGVREGRRPTGLPLLPPPGGSVLWARSAPAAHRPSARRSALSSPTLNRAPTEGCSPARAPSL